jgi:hypothetical protein
VGKLQCEGKKDLAEFRTGKEIKRMHRVSSGA